MKSLSVGDAFRSLAKSFGRFQVVIFLAVVLIGLSIATLSISSVLLDTSNAPGDLPGSVAPTVDQTTINELNALYTSADAPSHYQLPAGRTNPFAE